MPGLITNCDDTCADIKEEYQKELTVFAQCSDKNLTGIRNALLHLDTETSSVATTADGTTVDSDGSQEVDDAYESGGVPVAATTAGEDDSRIVMDGLGVSMAPGQDEGHNSVAAGAHSEVVPLHLVALSDGLGVSMAPGQDEGHNSAAAGAHSEVTLMVYPRLQMLVRSCCHSKLHPRQRYKFYHSICRHSRQHLHQRYG